jgi:apolipoprotein N-acyltransferase
VIVVDVPLGSGTTLYQRLGDWVPVLAFMVLGGAAGFAIFRWHRLARGDRLRG